MNDKESNLSGVWWPIMAIVFFDICPNCFVFLFIYFYIFIFSFRKKNNNNNNKKEGKEKYK